MVCNDIFALVAINIHTIQHFSISPTHSPYPTLCCPFTNHRCLGPHRRLHFWHRNKLDNVFCFEERLMLAQFQEKFVNHCQQIFIKEAVSVESAVLCEGQGGIIHPQSFKFDNPMSELAFICWAPMAHWCCSKLGGLSPGEPQFWGGEQATQGEHSSYSTLHP